MQQTQTTKPQISEVQRSIRSKRIKSIKKIMKENNKWKLNDNKLEVKE